MMGQGGASELSYLNATRLGQPRNDFNLPRIRNFYPTRPTGPAWRRRPISGFGDMGTRVLSPIGGTGHLGQPGAQISLPDGVTHTVRAVNPSGEILTTDGWQSATQTDGTERWINVHTGDVMLSTGETIKAARPSLFAGMNWWLIGGAGAAVLVVGYLAMQGAPVARRRARAAGRAYRYAR